MHLDQVAHDGESEAQASLHARAGAVRLAEAIEHVGQEIECDSHAGIGDHDLDMAVPPLQADGHLSLARRELDGVGEQVPHHLLQAIRVAVEVARLVAQVEDDLELLRFRRRADGIHRRQDDAAQVDATHLHAQLAGDDPRDVEDVVHQLRLDARVAFDGLQRPPQLLLALQRAGAEHAGPAEDGVERRPQLVRDGGEELVLRAVRLLELRARLLLAQQQRRVGLLDALLVVDVGGRGDPAHHRPMLVVLRDDPAEVPAQLAVVAPQPLLALEPATAADGPAPGRLHRGQLVRRHGTEEREPRVGARVLPPDPVAVVDLAVAPGRPHALGHRVGEGVEADLAAALQLAKLLGAQHGGLPLDQLAAAPEVDEDRDLGAQDLRVERLQQVVDRAL